MYGGFFPQSFAELNKQPEEKGFWVTPVTAGVTGGEVGEVLGLSMKHKVSVIVPQ
jgi:hypothetical protein